MLTQEVGTASRRLMPSLEPDCFERAPPLVLEVLQG
jgi:hypothetical protein